MAKFSLGLTYCYHRSSVAPNFFMQLIEKFVTSEPTYFTFRKKREKWHKNAIEIVRKNQDSSFLWLTLQETGESCFTISTEGRDFREFTIIQYIDSWDPAIENVESLISTKGLAACYLYNYDYDLVQSSPIASNFLRLGIDDRILDSVKNTPYVNDIPGTKYMVQYNPSSGPDVTQIPLKVASKMWLGPEFFKIVSKEVILKFQYAEEIREVSNDLIFVNLYDGIADPYTPEKVFRQWKWKEAIDYDSIIKGQNY